MEFKKVGKRFLLSPQERVIKILKKNKEMPMTTLSLKTSIHYDSLQRLLEKMSNEGLVSIIVTEYVNENDKTIVANRNVVWCGGKK